MLVQNSQLSFLYHQFQGSWPAKYRAKETKIRRQSPLDPNHSHFILVDDGTQHKFGVEISLRARVEKKISQLRTGDGKESKQLLLLCSSR